MLQIAVAAVACVVAMSCDSNKMLPEDHQVRMRDGERLHTRVWLPSTAGPYPVVLSRGYSAGYAQDFVRFNHAGYAYVGQQTRGQGGGDGSRFFADTYDGYDSVTWIAQQPWSNGQVAMYGRSYWAMTQWLVAVEGHPNLKAIVPQNASSDPWQNGYYHNGALSLAMTATGRAFSGEKPAQSWRDFFLHLPLIELAEIGLGNDRRLWQDYLSHPTFDDYWRAIALRNDGKDGKYGKIDIPVFIHSGWFDYYPGSALSSFKLLGGGHGNSKVRINVGATNHLGATPAGRQFPDAASDELALAIEWLDFVLRGKQSNLESQPPVRVYVMGVNEWRQFDEWPPIGAKSVTYFFHGETSHTGSLSTEQPLHAVPGQFVYDPADPCPTLGGSHSFLRDIPGLIQAGSVDQRANESRQDVLTYSTETLAEDIDVIGPIHATLYASSSAVDTDFTVKLLDVYPDGAAYNISEGIVRARFRNSVYEQPELLTPGDVYEFNVQLQPTANVFKAGHQIRIHLSSSNWPLWDRNLNTGENQNTSTAVEPTNQVIYQDADRPSSITLSVLTRQSPAN